jgi:HK97 family phage major capsid protein
MKRETLHETRAKLEAELAAIAESTGELTQESADTYDRIEDELADLAIQERAADIRERFDARQAEPTTPRVGLGGQKMEKADSLSSEWDGYLRWFRSRGQDRTGLSQRALNTGDDAAVIPADLQAELARLMGAVSGARQAVRVTTAPTDTKVPVVATRVALTAVTAEGTPFDATEPTFADIDFTTDQNVAATTELTFQVMQDARPDLIREVTTQHAEEIGRLWSSFFCNGLTVGGAVQTDAIFDAAKANINSVTAASTTAITVGELIKMRYDGTDGLPAQYWNSYGDLGWIMGQTAFAGLMALLDSTGRPIFQPSAAATAATGLQGTLLGLPVYIDAAAPAPAAGESTVVLMARNAYRVVDREPGMVTQINPWAKQASGITEVNSYARSVGRWIRPEAAVVLKMAAS